MNNTPPLPKDVEKRFMRKFKGYFIWDTADELMDFIAQELHTQAQAYREAVERVIEETVGNDYHNIGMGSLDYHEKSAVDAFIESFKSRLSKLFEGEGDK